MLPVTVSVSDLANLTATLLADSFETGNVEVSGPGGRPVAAYADTFDAEQPPPPTWRCLCSLTEGAFQSKVAASSVLNAPNCSLPCTGPTINRATCEVAEMCGECADGLLVCSARPMSHATSRASTATTACWTGTRLTPTAAGRARHAKTENCEQAIHKRDRRKLVLGSAVLQYFRVECEWSCDEVMRRVDSR